MGISFEAGGPRWEGHWAVTLASPHKDSVARVCEHTTRRYPLRLEPGKEKQGHGQLHDNFCAVQSGSKTGPNGSKMPESVAYLAESSQSGFSWSWD
jgi:hypothetical protein